MENKDPRQSGFTLTEIMIVVTIIGLLAAISMPAFSRIKQTSQNTRLFNDLRVFGDQLVAYEMSEGAYPEDSNTGSVPPELSGYIREGQWEAGSPIGGNYDIEKDSYGIISAVGVHGYNATNDQIEVFDEKFDDGNLSTGLYRKLTGDRYYLVIAE